MILNNYLSRTTSAAPLAVFRIIFGLLMCASMIRFWYHGWIEKLYINPQFHFHYLGFEWIQIPPSPWIYILFIVTGLSALSFAIGYRYRISIFIFFICFCYIELMDKTTYLNHYYFVSVVSFILFFLPAHSFYSWDAFNRPELRHQFIPSWNIDILKLMLAIVYIYAGIAKINYDWIFNAMPLAIWLPSKYEVPILGDLMHQSWLHYLASWCGMLYDLFIVFFLLWTRTRVLAFIMVVIFHVLTRVLFPIGMFPYIMIFATLIFFSPKFHERLLEWISKILKIPFQLFQNGKILSSENKLITANFKVLALFMVFQIIFPWRFLAYPGNLYWTEQGYRFSWRVMLMEKTAYANFKIVDGKTGKRFYVQNEDFLTAFQQKQMATQADLIVEYAHYLGDHFASQGHENIEIYVESYASLNGRPSQPYIDPDVDLMKLKNGLHHKTYILPMHE